MKCESCGMSIEAGPYCAHCVDDTGVLKPFEETLTRFEQWVQSGNTAASQRDAQAQALDYMKTQPARQNHPKLKAR